MARGRSPWRAIAEGPPPGELHERERWLWANPQALAMVREGLAQSARGEGHDLGSFAQYLDETNDSES